MFLQAWHRGVGAVSVLSWAHKCCWADDDVGLNVLRCGADIFGTNAAGLTMMWG